MSASSSITGIELSSLGLPFRRRILKWWHHSFYNFRLFWHFALGFLGCSFLDKYFEMSFSRLMSQFSKNAFQVALSSGSGQFEPRPLVSAACAFGQSSEIGHLGPSMEGLYTKVTRNCHKSNWFLRENSKKHLESIIYTDQICKQIDTMDRLKVSILPRVSDTFFAMK